MSERDDVVDRVMKLCGVDEEKARYYLCIADGNFGLIAEAQEAHLSSSKLSVEWCIGSRKNELEQKRRFPQG